MNVSWLAMHLLLAGLTAAAAPVKVDQVGWLQGCWRLESGGRVVEEHWMAPGGGIMVLREQDGRLAYEAHPSGQTSAVFLSQTADDSTAVFENPAHDFPQRVGYKRDGDSLLAWVEGTTNGKPRRVEFPYRRVACTGN